MNLQEKKILVTGADGFIGSHLTETLVRAGHDVRAFVYYNSFNSWGWLDSIPQQVRDELDVFVGDIRDPHGVKSAMRGCDVVLRYVSFKSPPPVISRRSSVFPIPIILPIPTSIPILKAP